MIRSEAPTRRTQRDPSRTRDERKSDPSDESQCVVAVKTSESFTTRLLYTGRNQAKTNGILVKEKIQKREFSGRQEKQKVDYEQEDSQK